MNNFTFQWKMQWKWIESKKMVHYRLLDSCDSFFKMTLLHIQFAFVSSFGCFLIVAVDVVVVRIFPFSEKNNSTQTCMFPV